MTASQIAAQTASSVTVFDPTRLGSCGYFAFSEDMFARWMGENNPTVNATGLRCLSEDYAKTLEFVTEVEMKDFFKTHSNLVQVPGIVLGDKPMDADSKRAFLLGTREIGRCTVTIMGKDCEGYDVPVAEIRQSYWMVTAHPNAVFVVDVVGDEPFCVKNGNQFKVVWGEEAKEARTQLEDKAFYAFADRKQAELEAAC